MKEISNVCSLVARAMLTVIQNHFIFVKCAVGSVYINDVPDVNLIPG